MKRDRYEIQVIRIPRTGHTAFQIYDDYWDSQSLLSPSADEHSQASIFRNRAGAAVMDKAFGEEVWNLKPGTWYAIPVENYPFGEIGKPYQIPGRHRRYRQSR